MEDPTVRYTQKVGGQMWRQHIDVNGSMGGMVEDGVNAEPGAFIDINSTVRGHGLTIAEGAQIINSDVNFEHGAGPGSAGPGYRLERLNRLTTRAADRRESVSFKATIDDTVADSVVTWKRSTAKDARGFTNTRSEKVVRSKADVEAGPSWPVWVQVKDDQGRMMWRPPE